MTLQGLSFDAIPPVHVPLRFFNTAPWMGVLAGLVLLTGLTDSLSSQWSPTLLGCTHLLTLGFMAMIMLGALFQLLPVISGVALAHTRSVATLVHLCLSVGTVLLACGFALRYDALFSYALFGIALPLLLLAFVSFLLALGYLLVHRLSGGTSIFTVRLAAAALLITVSIGLLRAGSYVTVLPLPAWPLINTYTHLAWGLGGWVLLLVMGVSYQVIPMFHVTPAYPSLFARLLPCTVFAALLLLTSVAHPVGQMFAIMALCLAAALYAACTLWLLSRRKRKRVDMTVNFWRLAMSNLLVASVVLAGVYLGDDSQSLVSRQSLVITFGIISIYGVACSVIMGMLQKIIPFLLYLHLQRLAMADIELLSTLPHNKMILPDWRSQWQWRLHLLALALLLIACWYPLLTPLAAVMMMVDFAFLGYCIAMATRLYIKTQKTIHASLTAFASSSTPDSRVK